VPDQPSGGLEAAVAEERAHHAKPTMTGYSWQSSVEIPSRQSPMVDPMAHAVTADFEDAMRQFRLRKAREFKFSASNLGQTQSKRQDYRGLSLEGSTRFHPPLIVTPALRSQVSPPYLSAASPTSGKRVASGIDQADKATPAHRSLEPHTHFLIAKRLASDMEPFPSLDLWSAHAESASNALEPRSSLPSRDCNATRNGGLRFGWRMRSTDQLRSTAPRAWYPGTTNIVRYKDSIAAGAPETWHSRAS
jgi:hypothetical protein